MIQLPDDVVNCGYKEVRPFHHEQMFSSKSKGFIGTEKEFVKAGYGYEFIQLTSTKRLVI